MRVRGLWNTVKAKCWSIHISPCYRLILCININLYWAYLHWLENVLLLGYLILYIIYITYNIYRSYSCFVEDDFFSRSYSHRIFFPRCSRLLFLLVHYKIPLKSLSCCEDLWEMVFLDLELPYIDLLSLIPLSHPYIHLTQPNSFVGKKLKSSELNHHFLYPKSEQQYCHTDSNKYGTPSCEDHLCNPFDYLEDLVLFLQKYLDMY